MKMKRRCDFIQVCPYIGNVKISEPEELKNMLYNLCLDGYEDCPHYRDYQLLREKLIREEGGLESEFKTGL